MINIIRQLNNLCFFEQNILLSFLHFFTYKNLGQPITVISDYFDDFQTK